MKINKKRKKKKEKKPNPDQDREISVDTVFLKDYFMRKSCYTVIGDEFFSIDI